MNQSLVDNQF